MEALRSESERKLLVAQRSYDSLERDFAELGGKVDRLEKERRELLREWEERSAENRDREHEWRETEVSAAVMITAARRYAAACREKKALAQRVRYPGAAQVRDQQAPRQQSHGNSLRLGAASIIVGASAKGQIRADRSARPRAGARGRPR